MVIAPEVFGEIVYLGMTVMASSNTIISPRSNDLIKFYFTILTTLFIVTGLQVTAAAATAVIVGPVGVHINKIFFSDNRFNNKSQIFRCRISKTFADYLTWVLDGKFNFQILIPV